MNYSEFIKALNKRDWNLKDYAGQLTLIETDIVSQKILKTSEEFKNFIKSFQVLSNKEDNMWFLSLQDYLKENDGQVLHGMPMEI